MISVKRGEYVLLLGKKESFLVKVGDDLNTHNGLIKGKDLQKKKFGSKIKTHLGKEFVIVKPTIDDLIKKKVKRSAQVILPKDAAMILAYTGVTSDSLVVDAGTGTGYLAIFLANFLSRGEVITYEKDRRFVKVAKENIKSSGLTNIRLKQKDVTKGIRERNVDLITLDLKEARKVIKHAHHSLRIGGWLVVYSPTTEHLILTTKEIKRKGFNRIKTVENIVREWQIEKTTRPKTMGLMHTGWLTFARKFTVE